MKNLLYLLFVLPLLFSCGDATPEEPCEFVFHEEFSTTAEFENWCVSNWYGKNVNEFWAKYGKHDQLNSKRLQFTDLIKIKDAVGVVNYYDVFMTYSESSGSIRDMELMNGGSGNIRKYQIECNKR